MFFYFDRNDVASLLGIHDQPIGVGQRYDHKTDANTDTEQQECELIHYLRLFPDITSSTSSSVMGYESVSSSHRPNLSLRIAASFVDKVVSTCLVISRSSFCATLSNGSDPGRSSSTLSSIVSPCSPDVEMGCCNEMTLLPEYIVALTTVSLAPTRACNSSCVGSHPIDSRNSSAACNILRWTAAACAGSLMIRFRLRTCWPIACLIHHVAYVENLKPFSHLKRSTAFIRPMFPSWIRSSIGRLCPRYCLAIETTRRRLHSMSFFRALSAADPPDS